MTLHFLFPGNTGEWQDWLVNDLPTLAGVLAAVVIINLVSRPLIGRTLRGAAISAARLRGHDPGSAERRVRTLQGTLTWSVTFVAAFIGMTVALDTLGLNVAALVAGVGVVGIAFGLGAQTLIKDVINGLFILVEDQYSVGDQVTVAGISGEVTEINPRRTIVRDGNGAVHTIPNSAITIATNRSPSLGVLRLTLAVSFRDVDAATALVQTTAAEVAGELGGAMISAPRIAFQRTGAQGDVELHLTAEVRPAARWEVEGELRRRLTRRFTDERLDLGFPPGE